MTTLVDTPLIGLERIAREALIVLIEVLNDEIPAQDALWAPLDEELATLRGITYEPTVLEEIAPENFYPGHRPSLIKAPIDKYPNVSVMADRAGPAPNDDLDQISVYQDSLVVEVMAKSERSEEEVNARVQRLVEAVNVCLMSNRTLRGVVNELQSGVKVGTTDVFIRREKTSHGDKWFWQGARMEYVVIKEAAFPQGSFSRPASTPLTAVPAGADFDQGP